VFALFNEPREVRGSARRSLARPQDIRAAAATVAPGETNAYLARRAARDRDGTGPGPGSPDRSRTPSGLRERRSYGDRCACRRPDRLLASDGEHDSGAVSAPRPAA